jgi:hypothetical protein
MFAPAWDIHRSLASSNVYIIRSFEIQTLILGVDRGSQWAALEEKALHSAERHIMSVFKRPFELHSHDPTF